MENHDNWTSETYLKKIVPIIIHENSTANTVM